MADIAGKFNIDKAKEVFPEVPMGEPLTVNDALRLAVVDKEFATAFTKDPEQFAETFSLNKYEIEAIRSVGARAPEFFNYE